MDTLRAFEKLAKQAQGEKVPSFDVTAKVLQRIRFEEAESAGIVAFELFASISAVAASVVGYFSIGALRSVTSPLMQFLTPLQEVRIW
ncbi:MAG: hypothetical protein AMJ65_18220 [Phycisphaerae bacterium SG8_4]|nr:MAG: hypothetical protein AMJ65_18220 [Phycisphaerae bacterium SG8_4]